MFEGPEGISIGLAAVEAVFVVAVAFGVVVGDLGEIGGVDGFVALAVAASTESVSSDGSEAGLGGAHTCVGPPLEGARSYQATTLPRRTRG